MKFIKILAALLAICMLSVTFVACDNSGKDKETETDAGNTVSIFLIIKEGSKEVAREKVICNGTLGDAIEMYAAGEDYEGECFNETTGILKGVSDKLVAEDGESWIAYEESTGESGAFDSIKDQVVTEGQRIILVLDKTK